MNQFLTYAPPLAALAVFLSPLKTIRDIQLSQTTGDLPPLTYVSMSVMSAIWGTYGGLRNDMTVLVPNLIGSILSLYYLYVFESNVPKGSKSTELARWYQAGIATLAVMLLQVAFADLDSATGFVGTSGAVISVIFSLSPLVALPAVRRTRSPESIPLATAVMMFTNSTLWFAYGLSVNDKSIYLSNFAGVASSAIQLLVHLLFATGIVASKPPAESGVKVASL